MDGVVGWLLACDEPWTRYRALRDLLDLPEDDPAVQVAHAEMLAHPATQGLIAKVAAWPGDPLKRHNDAGHALCALSVLADFGLRADDPGMEGAVAAILAHQSPEGAFETLTNIAIAFGGDGSDSWLWMACDAPTLLYVLLSLSLGDDERVQQAAAHLASLARPNGWPCAASPRAGKFRGPGRKDDPCPIANLLAIKALALAPEWRDSEAAHTGVEMLLWHWEHRREAKPYLFGMGSNFAKLKYPLLWYDILHAVEALSRYPFARSDPRFREMLTIVIAQADGQGRYTAGSMYQAWKGWSFANKKAPSPWLTLLAQRIQRRMGEEA